MTGGPVIGPRGATFLPSRLPGSRLWGLGLLGPVLLPLLSRPGTQPVCSWRQRALPWRTESPRFLCAPLRAVLTLQLGNVPTSKPRTEFSGQRVNVLVPESVWRTVRAADMDSCFCQKSRAGGHGVRTLPGGCQHRSSARANLHHCSHSCALNIGHVSHVRGCDCDSLNEIG